MGAFISLNRGLAPKSDGAGHQFLTPDPTGSFYDLESNSLLLDLLFRLPGHEALDLRTLGPGLPNLVHQPSVRDVLWAQAGIMSAHRLKGQASPTPPSFPTPIGNPSPAGGKGGDCLPTHDRTFDFFSTAIL